MVNILGNVNVLNFLAQMNGVLLLGVLQSSVINENI